MPRTAKAKPTIKKTTKKKSATKTTRKTLSEMLAGAICYAVGSAASYHPDKAMEVMPVPLTDDEKAQAHEFLNWVHVGISGKGNAYAPRHFGPKDVHKRYAEFVKSNAKAGK